MAKNPGFGTRSAAVSAALGVATAGKPSTAPEEDEMKPVGFRLPTSLHDELRRISYEKRIPINTLIIAGVRHVVEQEKIGTLNIKK